MGPAQVFVGPQESWGPMEAHGSSEGPYLTRGNPDWTESWYAFFPLFLFRLLHFPTLSDNLVPTLLLQNKKFNLKYFFFDLFVQIIALYLLEKKKKKTKKFQ